MTLDNLNNESARLDVELAKARTVAAQFKKPVDDAQAARERAGFPRNSDHPTFLNFQKALVEYEKANSLANELYAQLMRVRSRIQEQQTKEYGSTTDNRTIARQSAAPNAQEISDREERKRLEEQERLHPTKPLVEESAA